MLLFQLYSMFCAEKNLSSSTISFTLFLVLAYKNLLVFIISSLSDGAIARKPAQCRFTAHSRMTGLLGKNSSSSLLRKAIYRFSCQVTVVFMAFLMQNAFWSSHLPLHETSTKVSVSFASNLDPRYIQKWPKHKHGQSSVTCLLRFWEVGHQLLSGFSDLQLSGKLWRKIQFSLNTGVVSPVQYWFTETLYMEWHQAEDLFLFPCCTERFIQCTLRAA